MGNYIPEISNAIANGAIFDPYPVQAVSGVISQITDPTIAARFDHLKTHLLAHHEDFVYNMTVFTQVYYDQQQYDVNKYFGTLLGNAASLANAATSAIAASDTAALTAISIDAQNQVDAETLAVQDGVQYLTDLATAISLNELVNTPLGAFALGKAGSSEIKAVVNDRNIEVSEELDIAIVDPSLPVSNDPTEFVENRDADAR